MAVDKVRKQAPRKATPEEIESADVVVPNEGQAEPKAVPVKVTVDDGPSKHTFYVLLTNDRVQKIGASLTPQGDWYFTPIDLSVPKMYGPYPLLVPTKYGLEPVSGYVQLSGLTDLVYSEIRRMGLKGLRTEPPCPINNLRDVKMMSCIVSIDL